MKTASQKSRYDFALDLIESCKIVLEKEKVSIVEEKENEKDLVTNLDKTLNNHIVLAISSAFDDDIVGEEQSKEGNKKIHGILILLMEQLTVFIEKENMLFQ